MEFDSYKKRHNRVFVLFAAFLISGCSATPPLFGTPPLNVEIPAEWMAKHFEGEDNIKRAWWVSFNDSALNAVISEAITNNHDLKAASLRVETAAAEARVVGADLYPQVQGGTNAARSKQVVSAGSSGGSSPASIISNSYGVSLDVSWELDIWGRIRSGASAAIGDLQAQQSEYKAAALSLVAQVTKAWFAVTEAQLQLVLTNETVENYRTTARQAANRVDAGVQSPTDKHLTAANLATAESLKQQRTETLKRSTRQLEILLGRYPSGQIKYPSSLPEVPVTPEMGIPVGLLTQRPDLIAAERRLAAADKRIDVAQASLLPRFSLTSNLGTTSNELENLLNGNFLGWMIAGNLVQPLFQGGRLRAQVDVAKGRTKEAAENYAQLALIAFGEVETVLAIDENLRLREEAQSRSAKAAQQAAKVAENRYGQGIETLLAVLEGQRRTLDAKSAQISVHRQRLENRVDLYLALGGGFDELHTPEFQSSIKYGAMQ